MGGWPRGHLTRGLEGCGSGGGGGGGAKAHKPCACEAGTEVSVAVQGHF